MINLFFNGKKLETSERGGFNSQNGKILYSFLNKKQWNLLGYNFEKGNILYKRISSGKMLFFKDEDSKEVRIASTYKALITHVYN